MPEIQHVELERENDTGVRVVRGGEHGEPPVDDPPPAEPKEPPAELTSREEHDAEARESESAFDRAIVRLPPG